MDKPVNATTMTMMTAKCKYHEAVSLSVNDTDYAEEKESVKNAYFITGQNVKIVKITNRSDSDDNDNDTKMGKH